MKTAHRSGFVPQDVSDVSAHGNAPDHGDGSSSFALSPSPSPLPPSTLLGVVLCSLKTIYDTKLQLGDQREKISLIDSHAICASAGLTADAMVLVRDCRVSASLPYNKRPQDFDYRSASRDTVLYSTCQLPRRSAAHDDAQVLP